MGDNYAYPLDPSWSTPEIEAVVAFLNTVEAAYEGGVDAKDVLSKYRAFKQVVPSKGEEKQVGKAFVAASGYQLYEVVKAATAVGSGTVQIG